ncbi:amidohydrolase family-domain-containing protein [Thelephora terrestris]|uniref:Amidohydrolase family-domain-containing protein n=1 Tax=Thelephora terrestris TaxID=56493 RepID=A0A9P6L2U8_9AGAM|nr:amidohydrolase family-domain-containing protein [Thelephora terrestris]
MNLVRNFALGLTTATLARYTWSSIYDAKFPSSYTVCTTGHGTIYTVDEMNPTAECVSVKDGRLVAVGPRDSIDIASSTVPMYETKPGSIIVPGLSDAHAHILEYGWKMQLVLDGANSIEEIISRVKAYLRSHPEVADDPTTFIEGMGWDQNRWASKQFPTADDLSDDPELAGRRIVLTRVDGHATWVSKPVLELMIAGGKIPKDVSGGEVIRDKGGFPTGIFVDNAMSLVPVPDKTPAQVLAYFKTAMQDALEVGLTNIHDAGGQDQYIDFYKEMADTGKLPVRIYLMRAGPPADDISEWDKIKPLINYGENERFNVQGVKLFMDGALGSWGAALLEPYSDNNSTSGLLTTEPEDMRNYIEQAWRYGWQVNVHAIGDRANHIVLDIFEDMQSKDPGFLMDRRPRIEHSQIMTLDDLDRSGRLGVINSVQPTHATSDMEYAESRLGPQRIKGAYAYKTMLRNSRFNVLPLGSDFPIEGINPLLGFYAAVSRLSVAGDSPHGPGGWYPSDALTRAEALKGMTLDPAYASFSEQELGSLEKGKKADFVVLDQDIMKAEMSKVLSTKVEATVIDGQVLYGGFGPSGGRLVDISFLVQEATRLRDRVLGQFFV